MEKTERVKYFNVLKGIAIALVVAGHATAGFIHNYCYSYHLALFFCITGFLYNEKKYGMNPALFFGNKMKNNWGKYVIYTSLIGLLHFTIPIWGDINFIGDPWNSYILRNYVLNNMVMTNTESLCGAMWFIAPFIVSSGLLGLIVYAGNIVEKATSKKSFKHIVIISLTIICLLLGNERMLIKIKLGFRLDIALFVLPLLIIGYYANTYLKDFSKYLKFYIAIPCILITLYFCKKGFSNSLNGQGVEVKLFYFLACIGIYQSMYISKFLCKFSKVVSKIFAFLGKYTFEIMAFHFLVFKLIDVAWYIFTGDSNIDIITAFPHSYNIGFIYTILGCGLPAVVKWAFDTLIHLAKAKCRCSNTEVGSAVL